MPVSGLPLPSSSVDELVVAVDVFVSTETRLLGESVRTMSRCASPTADVVLNTPFADLVKDLSGLFGPSLSPADAAVATGATLPRTRGIRHHQGSTVFRLSDHNSLYSIL